MPAAVQLPFSEFSLLLLLVSSLIRLSFLLSSGFPTVAEWLDSTTPSRCCPPTGRSTWANSDVCGSSKGFQRSPMVGMQRGRRAGYNSPIIGPIDGIETFVGYPLRSPVRGRTLSIVAAAREFGGRGWPECVQLGEGYTSVVSAVDSARLSLVRNAVEILLVKRRRDAFRPPANIHSQQSERRGLKNRFVLRRGYRRQIRQVHVRTSLTTRSCQLPDDAGRTCVRALSLSATTMWQQPRGGGCEWIIPSH